MKNHKNIGIILIGLFAIILLSSCSSTSGSYNSRLGILPEDFARSGVSQLAPEPWEDGQRIKESEVGFEWWYFDVLLKDGTTVVVVYMGRDVNNLDQGADARMIVNINPTDGDMFRRRDYFPRSVTSFALETTNVKMGPNYLRGNLRNYELYFKSEDSSIEINLNLRRIVPSYRPGNGYWYFGNNEYFAWFVAVPHGEVTGEFTYGGVTRKVEGTGYHDHNWGNVSFSKLFKNWWWGRAQLDDYTVITAEIRTRDKYGGGKIPVFIVSDSSGIIIDSAKTETEVSVRETNIIEHLESGEPIAQTIQFFYKSGEDSAEFRYDAESIIESFNGLEAANLPPILKTLALLAGATPWYTRWKAEGSLTLNLKGLSTKTMGEAVLEKMDLE